MSSVVYNSELEICGCYCGRFDGQPVVYPEELTWLDGHQGECRSCIELSKCEDLLEEQENKVKKIKDKLVVQTDEEYEKMMRDAGLKMIAKSYYEEWKEKKEEDIEMIWCCGNRIPKSEEAVGCKDCF